MNEIPLQQMTAEEVFALIRMLLRENARIQAELTDHDQRRREAQEEMVLWRARALQLGWGGTLPPIEDHA